MNSKYLSFSISSENYLIPLSFISAIYQISSKRGPFSNFQEDGVGHMSFRGKKLPVFCLTTLLGGASKHRLSSMGEHCVIDLKLSSGDFGAFVENLEGIVSFNSSDVQVFKDPIRPTVCGKAYGIRKTYMVLDPEKMIDKIRIKKIMGHPSNFEKAG